MPVISWATLHPDRRAALAALPGYAAFPPHATTWADYAARAIDALLHEDDCWLVEPSTGIKGFRPYVRGTDQWGGADRTRQITELMAMMDVLWPMVRYFQLHPDPARQALVNEFIHELPTYYDPAVQQSTNRPGAQVHDSWYFMENAVLKYGHLYWISGAEILAESYAGNLRSAIQMARNFDYLFPQFVDTRGQRADRYNTVNYSTAGLLAYALVHARQITGDAAMLDDAARALIAMRGIEHPRDLLYEPQELAAAASAAACLADSGSGADFAALAQDFFYAQLQLMYYGGGQIDLDGLGPQSSAWLPPDWRDGQFVPYYNPVERRGINAPAFKENIESVLFWIDFLRQPGGAARETVGGALKVMNLNRVKNFWFFSPSIPAEWERDYGPGSPAYIPYEDIDYYDVRPHEDESARFKAGYNGKEIYGAGEVLWAYLLFEALGDSADRHALIVNLNALDPVYPPPAAARRYLVFNPYAEARTLTFTLRRLDAPVNVLADGAPVGVVQPGEPFALALPAGGWASVTLVDR